MTGGVRLNAGCRIVHRSGCPTLTTVSSSLGWASRCARPLSFAAALLLTLTTPAQTTITLTAAPIHQNVHPFGINLSGQTFYDSGQLLRNLIARNPGFEAETWRSILHCKSATPTTCTDENPYTTWPPNFLANAHYEVLSTESASLFPFRSGAKEPAVGTILSTTKANPPQGITLTLSGNPNLKPNDFLLTTLDIPGDPTAGWWPSTTNAATFTPETQDLSPHTPGHQALRIQAALPNQTATLSSYFDSTEHHSFVQLHGLYTLTFRAKPLTPNATLHLLLNRLTTPKPETFLDRTLPLKPGWNDYTLNLPINEPLNSIGTAGLTFTVTQASILLDDVSLEAASPGVAAGFSPRKGDTQKSGALAPKSRATNPTAFRDEVVQTLRDLHPGTLRYMDNGASFGSSLANLLAPTFARQRSGHSTQETRTEDIPIGLPDFLTLCKAIQADPWITVPPGLTPTEATQLITYLKPWTFHTIHLELGNEQWNNRSFAGATINDPTAYAHRAAAIFAAMRATPGFDPHKFDLIMGSWLAVPWWTQQELAAANDQADSIALAPYLFSEFNSAPNEEQTFGPMFAQPEQLDSRPTGLMAQQAALTTAAHKNLAIYETNLGTMSGTVPQSAIDVTVPSLGAALAVADHMLLMLRDLGITTQNLFALPEYENPFRNDSTNRATGAKQTVPLWGAVIDMGGPTNRRRPTFLALQLLNSALLPTEITTTLTGTNPTWNQPPSPNDKIALPNAHYLQTFAFSDAPAHHRSLILLNLSRDQSLPIQLAGPEAPTGPVTQTTLTAPHITDNNEQSTQVEPHQTPYSPNQSLPPHSLTVLTWTKP